MATIDSQKVVATASLLRGIRAFIRDIKAWPSRSGFTRYEYVHRKRTMVFYSLPEVEAFARRLAKELRTKMEAE